MGQFSPLFVRYAQPRARKGGLFTIVATRYTVIYDEGRDIFFIQNKDAPVCPICGSIMSGYDHRKRRVIRQDGTSVIYLIRRLHCVRCNKVHAELPDSLTAYKHYAAEVISKVRNGDDSECPADDSTIRRWRK